MQRLLPVVLLLIAIPAAAERQRAVRMTPFDIEIVREYRAADARTFLAEAGLVDRLLLYRAPVLFGEGIPAFRDPASSGAPAGWKCVDRHRLGSDTLEVYTPHP